MKINVSFLVQCFCLLFQINSYADNNLAFKDCANLNSLKIVVIAEDQVTIDWLKQELSKYDKVPIVGSETPDKRKRELYLRLQESLNALGQSPVVVAWDYFFPLSLVTNPKEESPATKDFARALNKSSIPIVLASWTGGGDLDYRIHTEGAHRFTGHISLFRDKEGVRFSPVSKMDKRLREYLTQDTFAVATIAAILNGKCRAAKKLSLQTARKLACQSADEKPAQEIAHIREKNKELEINGIKLAEFPVQTLSMKSVILGDSATIEALKDAVVIIGNATADIGGIFKDDKSETKPLVYVHAWTIAEILSHMSTIGPFENKKRDSGLICSGS
jgi:hypothetical protein